MRSAKTTFLPVAVKQVVHGLLQLFRILSYQYVCALFHRLYMFCITVQCDARYTIEGCLLSHVTAVGNHTKGMGGEVTELEVRKRRNYH